MSPAGCDRLWEIDVLLEGKLSAKDEESFARHAGSCEVCAKAIARDERLRELALAMPVAEPNELELRRLRSRILDQVATRPASHRPRAAVVAALVAPLLVALSSWAFVRSRAASGPAPMASSSASAAREPTPAVRPLEQETFAAPIESKPVEARSESSAAPAPRVGGARDAGRSTVARMATDESPTGDAAIDAYAAAVALFHRGDFASASLAFRAFSRMYPREPQVEDATYLDAVALARAGRADAASAAAADHLTRFPRSFHRREASILIARAARDRGDCTQARRVLAPWLVPSADPEAEATLRACAEPESHEK